MANDDARFSWLYWPSMEEQGREYSVDDIISHASMYKHAGPGIYFLISLDEVVYVGQSHDIANRLKQHWESGKDFNRYFVIRCESENLNKLEAYYILKFRPRYNIAIPKEKK